MGLAIVMGSSNSADRPAEKARQATEILRVQSNRRVLSPRDLVIESVTVLALTATSSCALGAIGELHPLFPKLLLPVSFLLLSASALWYLVLAVSAHYSFAAGLVSTSAVLGWIVVSAQSAGSYWIAWLCVLSPVIFGVIVATRRISFALHGGYPSPQPLVAGESPDLAIARILGSVLFIDDDWLADLLDMEHWEVMQVVLSLEQRGLARKGLGADHPLRRMPGYLTLAGVAWVAQEIDSLKRLALPTSPS